MENRIREQIQSLGVTKRSVAEGLGITPVGLNKLFSKESPRISTLEKVAGMLKIPAWRLILTDEEIAEIQALAPNQDGERQKSGPAGNPDEFRCPRCGARLRIVDADAPSSRSAAEGVEDVGED